MGKPEKTGAGKIRCPGLRRVEKLFRGLAEKLVVPHCSPLVWVWGVIWEGGSGLTRKPPRGHPSG